MSLEPRRTVINPTIYTNLQRVPNTQNRNNQTSPNTQNPVIEREIHIGPEIYRQYVVQTPAISIRADRVNDSEADMREVYELDSLVFAQQDPYESYEEFINFVNDNQLSTYVIRDENNNNKIIGYYQLEPVKNGDLYIDSIGLKPEYRNSRKGYQTIKYAWEKILDYAKENGASTLSLHVDAGNRNLVRMYQNLGFTIKETLNDYYDNGSDAYFMERPVEDSHAGTAPAEQNQEIEPAEGVTVTAEQAIDEEQVQPEVETTVTTEPAADEEPVQPQTEIIVGSEPETIPVIEENNIVEEPVTEEVTVPEITAPVIEDEKTTELVPELPDEIVEETEVDQTPKLSASEVLFNEKMAQAETELLAMGVEQKDILKYLKACNENNNSYLSCKSDVFNDDLFTCAKYLIQFEKDYKDNKKVLYFGEMNHSAYEKIISSLCEKDSSGNISRVRTDLLPYIREFAKYNMDFNHYDDIIKAATETTDNNSHISTKGLDTAKFLGLYMPTHRVENIINSCKVYNKNNDCYLSETALDCAKSSCTCNSGDDNSYEIEQLLKVSRRKDANGNQQFNPELYYKLKNHIKDDSLGYPNRLFYGSYDIERAYNAGCDLELMLLHGKAILKDEKIDKIARTMEYDKRDKLKYALFRACQYNSKQYSYSGTQYTSEDVIRFDNRVRDKFIELTQGESPVFTELEQIPKILESCKEKNDSFSDYKFNPELVEKAIQLKQAKIPEVNIPAIIEACKISETKTYDGELASIKFSDEIFNAAINALQNDSLYHRSYIVDYIKCSKDTVNGREVFRPQNFERLKHGYMIPSNSRDIESSLAFFNVRDKYNKTFDVDLHEKFISAKCNLSTICNSHSEGEEKEQIFTPSETIIDAYTELKNKNIKYTKRDYDSSNEAPEELLIRACRDKKDYENYTFNPQTYRIILELIDKGYDGRDVLDIIYQCKDGHKFYQPRYEMVKNLLEQGIDIINAGKISKKCVVVDKGTDEQALNKCLELYNMGVKDPVSALCIAGNDNIAYNRLKHAVSKNLPPELISECEVNNEFKDRLYRLALTLQDRNFAPNSIKSLMTVCHEKIENKESFNYDMFNHIADLEELGIEKDNISTILNSCKFKNKFSPEAYEKISQLHYKNFDDNGIAKFFKYTDNNGSFDEEKYNSLLKLTAKHEVLKGLTHDDSYVIEKISNYASAIAEVTELFGEDVMNNVVTAKIDNYIKFVNQSKTLKNKCSESFINDLNDRLNQLPSPELKVKRLSVLGALADKVDENALRTLTSLIKSPEMSDEQIKLANSIFSDKDTDYETRVEKFLREINAPENTRNTLREYLLKSRLDKQINTPKSIEEQMAQMDEFAQKMLTNPNTPLEKKLKYIEEFKAKKADMKANPQKYTTPKLFPKPLENLKRLVKTYVNIPNDDIRFNSSITTTMYNKFGIEVNQDLLESIHYDAKYFDKLFSASPAFVPNFKRLVELQKMNPHRPLSQIRLELPEEGTDKYNRYNELGLIEQIKANQDTVRKFKEHGLDFDRWNTFDENLKSNTFSVEADPETEYKNTKFNLINLFQDEFFNKINSEETKKLMEKLEVQGYTIFNNKLYKNGTEISNNDLEKFTQCVINYITEDKYWKSATVENSELTEDEITGITAFQDHIKDIANHIKEIRGAKTVNDIYLRLSDDSNIGRNIFFGNHVGCCNSVNSSYAGYSAPMHLLNNFNRGVELVDKYGNSYGNSMCFFAEVDGKLTFVIDSFEANGKLGSNPIVTDELIKFGKKVCKEMGREDAQVMLGANYNHIDESKLKTVNADSMKIVGTVSDETYCDSVGGSNVKDAINNGKKNVKMKVYEG